ncbi:MAG: hypothetical protein FWC66_05160 [Oscillospiraceae bacterium]|nr:hypothetical protein [Oscillospiraceae bacterium]
MTSLTLLTIDGRELPGLDIVRYTPRYEILDGSGTGRTRAPGWDMIRDPHGVICNFAIELFHPVSDNADFQFFMDTFFSFGRREFVRVGHTDMVGREWNQEMYYVVDGVDCLLFEGEKVHNSNVVARFIAKKGHVG